MQAGHDFLGGSVSVDFSINPARNTIPKLCNFHASSIMEMCYDFTAAFLLSLLECLSSSYNAVMGLTPASISQSLVWDVHDGSAQQVP